MPHANPIRIHLDESCHPGLAKALRLRGIDVSTSQEAGLLGAIDPDQLAHAHAEGRVLVTFDADFVALHSSNLEHSGICFCRPGKRSIGGIADAIALFWEVYDR